MKSASYYISSVWDITSRIEVIKYKHNTQNIAALNLRLLLATLMIIPHHKMNKKIKKGHQIVKCGLGQQLLTEVQRSFSIYLFTEIYIKSFFSENSYDLVFTLAATFLENSRLFLAKDQSLAKDIFILRKIFVRLYKHS